MGWAEVQSHASSTASGTSLTATLPSGTTQGNLLLAWVLLNVHGETVTPPSGWTQEATVTVSTSGKMTLAVFLLANCGGGLNSFTFTFSASGASIIVLQEFSGGNLTPMDQQATIGQSAASSISVGPTGADPAAGDLAVALICYGNASVLSYSGVTTGYTQDANALAGPVGSSPAIVTAAWYNTNAAAGAQSFSVTLSGTPTGIEAAGLITLLPASGGGGGGNPPTTACPPKFPHRRFGHSPIS